jgi:hypothetical protein
MWVLKDKIFRLEHFVDERSKAYAILSHTWGDDEVTFQYVQNGRAVDRAGYAKIACPCQQAPEGGLRYVWIDTCCIDKVSSTELSELIKSMFCCYSAVAICSVHICNAHEAVALCTRFNDGGEGLRTLDGHEVDPRTMDLYQLSTYD